MMAGCGASASTGTTSTAASGPPGGSTPGPHPCNPLDAPDTPLTLADLYGAGRDQAGTLYVADQGGRDHQRAFISNGTTLQRVDIAGSGLDGAGSLSLTISDPVLSIRIDGAGPNPTRMGIVHGPIDGKTFDVGSQGEVLTLVGPAALTGFAVKNLANNVVVEYNASLADGRRFFVTRPKVDWTYDDFRVFFGQPSDMEERPLVSASRGNTTFLTFTVDGTNYDAVLEAGPPLGNGHATVQPAGQAVSDLTLLSTSDQTGLSFVCTH
jgi:hypothetical protein